MRGLRGKTALITGATGLIGGATARRLADEGVTVYVGSRDGAKAGDWIAQQPADLAALLVPLQLDLADQASISAALDAMQAGRGLPTLLVANASRREGLATPFDELTHAHFTDLFGVDVAGHLICARELLARLPADIESSMVFLSSIYAVAGVDHRIYAEGMLGTPPQYPAVKAGAIGLARYLAARWAGRGVRVNALVAGGVRAPDRQADAFLERYNARTMQGRMARADEIASAVAFLLSDEASYITAHTLVVDGGLTGW